MNTLKAIRKFYSRIKNKGFLNKGYKLPSVGWVEVKRMGFRWMLRMDNYIDSEIAHRGVFEPESTKLVRDLIRPGMNVLDLGANIGYYTLILAEIVKPNGFVWAFEPVKEYREQLDWHIRENGFNDRVKVLPYGLSEKESSKIMAVDRTSATLHWPKDTPPEKQETVRLYALDDIVKDLDINHIDFIKVDIDGHEPKFIRGAANTLVEYRPHILIEFAQQWLYIAGSNALEQAQLLRDLGYRLYNIKTMQPYSSELEFLIDCGNYNRSCNVLAMHPGRDSRLW